MYIYIYIYIYIYTHDNVYVFRKGGGLAQHTDLHLHVEHGLWNFIPPFSDPPLSILNEQFEISKTDRNAIFRPR